MTDIQGLGEAFSPPERNTPQHMKNFFSLVLSGYILRPLQMSSL